MWIFDTKAKSDSKTTKAVLAAYQWLEHVARVNVVVVGMNGGLGVGNGALGEFAAAWALLTIRTAFSGVGACLDKVG